MSFTYSLLEMWPLTCSNHSQKVWLSGVLAIQTHFQPVHTGADVVMSWTSTDTSSEVVFGPT